MCTVETPCEAWALERKMRGQRVSLQPESGLTQVWTALPPGSWVRDSKVFLRSQPTVFRTLGESSEHRNLPMPHPSHSPCRPRLGVSEGVPETEEMLIIINALYSLFDHSALSPPYGIPASESVLQLLFKSLESGAQLPDFQSISATFFPREFCKNLLCLVAQLINW